MRPPRACRASARILLRVIRDPPDPMVLFQEVLQKLLALSGGVTPDDREGEPDDEALGDDRDHPERLEPVADVVGELREGDQPGGGVGQYGGSADADRGTVGPGRV